MHMLSGMHCGIQDEKKMNRFGNAIYILDKEKQRLEFQLFPGLRNKRNKKIGKSMAELDRAMEILMEEK